MGVILAKKIISKIKNWNKKVVSIRNNQNFPIELSDNERIFLISYMKKSYSYLEFGSGGSTFLALMKTEVSDVTSVESDNNWLEYLREWETIRNAEKCKRLRFISVDIGKTGAWGVPVEIEENKYLFPNYSQAPFSENKRYNLIFIDGRFRVACALQTILHSDKDTKIIMHDFNNRPEYHKILKFLDINDTIDSMAVFSVKDNYNKQDLLELYEEYKYEYR